MQRQWGVALLMFCAAGWELASSRQEFQLWGERLEAAGRVWRKSGDVLIASMLTSRIELHMWRLEMVSSP